MLNRLIKRIFSSNFARSVATLISGTVAAQALSVLSLPILTRLYTPEQFGHLASFSAVLIIISGVACFRYEVAIPLPEDDDEAIDLLKLSLFCTLITLILTIIFIATFGEDIAKEYFNSPKITPSLWLLPFAIAGSGIYNSLQYWAIRKKEFSLIAKTKIKQSIIGISTQLITGIIGIGSLGLILGQTLNNTAGIISLKSTTKSTTKSNKKQLTKEKIKKIASTAATYKSHPKYSIIETLANSAGAQIPLILIAGLTTSAELGFLMLALKILQAPLAVIGASISQVFLSHATIENRNGKLNELVEKTIKNISRIGIGPLFLFGASAPTILEILLGDHWKRSGEIIVWLIPAMAFQLIASPISTIFHIKQKQKLLLATTVSGFIFRTTITLIGHYYFSSATEAFALGSAVYYFVIIAIAINSCKINKNQIKSIAKYSLKSITPYVLIAITIHYTT